MLNSNNYQYGLISKLFHLFRLLLLLTIYTCVLIILYKGKSSYAFPLHMQMAVLLFIFIVCNIAWKLYNTKVNSLAVNKFEEYIQKLVYFCIYAAIIVVPVLGFSSYTLKMQSLIGSPNFSYNGFYIFGVLIIPAKVVLLYAKFLSSLTIDAEALRHMINFFHKFIAFFILPALVGLHILAALYHQFIIKNNILKRMF